MLDNVRFLSHEGPKVAGRRQKTRAAEEKRREKRSDHDTGNEALKAQRRAAQDCTATRLALVDASLGRLPVSAV